MVSKKIWMGIVVILIILISLGGWMYYKSQYFYEGGEKSIAELTSQEIKDIFEGEWDEPGKLEVLPRTHILEVNVGESSVFAFMIKNLLEGVDLNTFYYNITSEERNLERCGVSPGEIESWVKIGREETLLIGAGESAIKKVILEVPEDQPLCTLRLYLSVYYDETQIYDREYMDIVLEA
jgi:hypothetical protein